MSISEVTEPIYVGFWRRALAASLDNFVWFVGVLIILGWLPVDVANASDTAAYIGVVVVFSAWFNYFAICEWRWGQTIGKNATGIEVRRCEGARQRDPSDVGDQGISFAQASLRNLLRLVDFFGIGELMIVATKRKQRLGDKAANTVVVRRAPKPEGVAAVGAPSQQPPPIGGGAEPLASEPKVAPPPETGRRFRPVPWTPRDTLWGLIGGLALAIIIPPLVVAPFDPDLSGDGALLAAQAIFDGLLLMVAVGMASNWKFRPLRVPLERLGMRPFALSALGLLVATLVAYYIAAGLFATYVLQPNQEDVGGELGVGNPSIAVAVTAVVMIAVLAPVAEELFFRGFVFAGLRSRWSLWPAALTSGLIFGLVHAPTGITTVVPLAALGFALCWLYDRTGSLWPCVIAHAINNGLALAVVS
jgi:CAAX protease family protein